LIWTTACPDWEARIVDGRSLIACPPLYPNEAAAALDVFKALRIVDAAGSPTFGEAGAQWVFDYVSAVFGAYDSETGKRLIREFFLCVSKKNSKSTLAAGVMLTALIRNWRKSNELLILAPTIEAAQNSFKPAADMVRADPELNAADEGFLHIQDHLRTITHLKTKATLKVVAADSATVVGKKAAFVLIDELWEFGKQAKADAMLREATGGLVSRPEGFVISITTQADESPAGVFKDKLSYARKVRDGEVKDPKFLPVIYEFPRRMVEAQEYLEPANFRITNPNIGRSVSQDWLEDELRKELAKDAATRNTFLAKHLNIEIGISQEADRWRGADYWRANADKNLTLPALIARSEVATVGFDVGGLDDLFGLAVIGREKVTRQWLLWTRAYCVRNVLNIRKDIASRLLDFEREGSLIIRDKPADIIQHIVTDIAVVKDAGLLPEKDAIGFDPNSVAAMIEALIGIGVEDKMLRRLIQGPALSPAIWGLEHKLSDGTLTHCGSALMDWVVGNAKVELKGNGNLITKQVAGRAKIDPLHAAFCAAIPMSWNPERKREPEYRMMVFG
jgi:phage terminase large subunit-like protein